MYEQTRNAVRVAAQKAFELGLVAATSGNISARAEGEPRICITPTSTPYEKMTDEQIVVVDVSSGRPLDSLLAPSYELPMHLELYRARDEVGAIVHTHAPYITTLSILRKPLPPFIDEVVIHLGGTIEVTEYSFAGTREVGLNLLNVLGDRAGAILANHGNVCIGRTVEEALHAAIVMESAARTYLQALQVGEPVPLPENALRAGRRMYEERHRR